jgi:predicted TIM-barrel fold metal-dependent hydrolase
VIALEHDGSATVVIDVHCHLGPSTEPGKDGGRSAALVGAMDAVGADCACVFASAGKGGDYPLENDLILQQQRLSGGRLVAFARVHPFWRAEAVGALRGAADAGARGLKLHPFMDGAFMANDVELVHPLMRVASDHGLVVLVHSGWGWNSAPGVVADLARSFPEVPVIMGHSGRYGFHREAAAVGADLPNLFFDTAGLATPGAVEELVGRVGASRVLFGSDHPYTPIGFELEKIVRWSCLGWEEIGQIVGANATRLLGLDPPTEGSPRIIERGSPVNGDIREASS